jgi:hypothetical protein
MNLKIQSWLYLGFKLQDITVLEGKFFGVKFNLFPLL